MSTVPRIAVYVEGVQTRLACEKWMDSFRVVSACYGDQWDILLMGRARKCNEVLILTVNTTTTTTTNNNNNIMDTKYLTRSFSPPWPTWRRQWREESGRTGSECQRIDCSDS